jgi:hypothetical protein
MAFEDATGAKDTVWLVFDPRADAQNNIDSIFGEIETPIDSNNYWVRYCGTKPLNVLANGSIGSNTYVLNTYICSDKYTLPIIVSWDSTLLTEHYTPGGFQYATLYNDYIHYTYPSPGFDQELDMTTRSSIYLPEFNWWSQCHFPMYFKINSSTASLDECNVSYLQVFPNPTFGFIEISVENYHEDFIISLYSISGEILKTIECFNNTTVMSLSDLPSGIYILAAQSKSYKYIYYEKIIKY